MKVRIEKSFDKDIKKINRKNINRDIAELIEKFIEAEFFFDIGNCSKMKGHKSAYKIRLGDYRIGIFYENEIVVFSRILHRSKICQYFP